MNAYVDRINTLSLHGKLPTHFTNEYWKEYYENALQQSKHNVVDFMSTDERYNISV